MEDGLGSRIITDKKAVAWLCNPNQQRFLEPFWGQECSVAQAAQQMACDLTPMFRQVKRMLELGLLLATRIERRVGRPIRYYRVSAERFFIPFEHKSMEEILLESNVFFEQRSARAIAGAWLDFSASNHGWGLSLTRAANGRVQMQVPTTLETSKSPIPHKPILSMWREWKLTPADARALQAELSDILERYAQKQNHDQDAYLVRLSLCPAEP